MVEIEELTQKMEGFQSFISNSFGSMVDSFGNNVSTLGNILNQAFSGQDADISEGIKRSVDSLKSLQDGAKNTANSLSEINFDSTNIVNSVSRMVGELGPIASELGGTLKEGFEQSFGQIGDKITGAIGPAAAAGAARLRKNLIDTFDNIEVGGISFDYSEAEDDLLDLREVVLNTANSFGALDASSREINFSEFTARLRESSTMLGVTQEAVQSVTQEISKGFGLNESIRPLQNFSRLQGEIGTTLTATNTAIRIAQATGQDFSNVAQTMSEAALNLNMSLEETVLMFGKIENSTKLSGLGFERTTKALMESASTLRMFGADLNTVAPAFDTFAKSMSGRNMKGLTDELTRTFVSSVSSVANDLGKSAFMGIQAGLGDAGGALGASLEIEAALQEGDLSSYMETLTETLERFGGGEITTLEDARRDPSRQRDFVIQRQLLSQFGIEGAATQSRMLEALQDQQRTGIAGESARLDAESILADTVARGQEIEDQTVSTDERAAIELQSATLAANEKIVEGVEKLLTGSTFSELMSSYTDEIRNLAENRVGVGEAVRRFGRTARDPGRRIRETLNQPEQVRRRRPEPESVQKVVIENMTEGFTEEERQRVPEIEFNLNDLKEGQRERFDEALAQQYGSEEEVSRLRDLEQKHFSNQELTRQEAADYENFVLSQEKIFNAVKSQEESTGIGQRSFNFSDTNIPDIGLDIGPSLRRQEETQNEEARNIVNRQNAGNFSNALNEETRSMEFGRVFDTEGISGAFKNALESAVNNFEAKEVPVNVNISVTLDQDTLKIQTDSKIADALKTGENQ